jgi:hypothetical protein
MFRISGRRPPATLDDATIEHLFDGGSIDDLPDALRPLGEVLAAATSAPTPEELDGSTTAAASFVIARASAGLKPRRTHSVGVSVFSVLLLVGSTGTAVAAAEGRLPEPVQQVAHDALGVVGVSVPGITHRDRDGAPAVTTDGSTTPPAAVEGTPTVPGLPTPGTSTGGTTAPGSGSTGTSMSSDAPGGSADAPGQTTAPSESPPGQADKPAEGGGTPSDDQGGAGNGNDPGWDRTDQPKVVGPKDAPPDQ